MLLTSFDCTLISWSIIYVLCELTSSILASLVSVADKRTQVFWDIVDGCADYVPRLPQPLQSPPTQHHEKETSSIQQEISHRLNHNNVQRPPLHPSPPQSQRHQRRKFFLFAIVPTPSSAKPALSIPDPCFPTKSTVSLDTSSKPRNMARDKCICRS